VSPATIEMLKALAAILAGFATFLGGLYIIVTRPMLEAMRATSNQTTAEVNASTAKSLAELKTEISGLRVEMKDMESRLNARIDSHVVHR
jgi:hypothetical protein